MGLCVPESTGRRLTAARVEILFRVKLGSKPPFRPDVTPSDCPRELLSLMKLCWNESPVLRPSFAILKQLMRKYTR